ncbi:MAG: phenylacetate--CoA ligase family protein [Nitrososphaerales archaeon]
MLHRVLWYCYELSRNQWLGSVELKQLQEKRLRDITTHAYNNVPLYKEKFDAQGIRPEHIRSLEDVQKLPFTTKQEVRDGIPDRSMARGSDLGDCIRASTSGTSGGPMAVFYDKRFMDYCMAAWRFRKRLAIGVKPWQKVMVIGYGGLIAPKKDQDQSGELARMKRKSQGRESLGPIVHLLRDREKRVTVGSDANEVLTQILKFDPKLIRGTPSYLRLLAEAMAERGIEGLGDKVVRTEGEVTDEETRKYLESSFKCKVFDEYSSWDFGNGAWQCTKREGYHIDADLLILEVVRGNERVSPGERGEIVVTNLLNYAMPLIRYRVGDIGVLDGKTCSCGRGLPLLKSIEGREADCFTLPGGQLITPRTIMTVIQGTPGVSRYQAVQESMNQVRIELMRRGNEPEVSKDELVARCHSILGEDMEIEVSITDRKNLKAKFRPVISKPTVAEEPRWTIPRG